jgi:hypothetical protein
MDVCFRGLPVCAIIKPVGWLPELADTCKTDVPFRVSMHNLINLFVYSYVRSVVLRSFSSFRRISKLYSYHNCFPTFFFTTSSLSSFWCSCQNFAFPSKILLISAYLLIFYYNINSFFLHFLLSHCHSFFLISALYFSLLSSLATLFFILLSFFSRSTLLILWL